MRNLLALAAFCVITFATVGYFQGWYMVKADITQMVNAILTLILTPKKSLRILVRALNLCKRK